MRPASGRAALREDHEQFREQVRSFVAREIAPHHLQWEDDGRVPPSLWQAAGAAGLLCTTLPGPWGAGGDFGHAAVVIEELARVHATGVGFSLHSEVVAPCVHAYGTSEQHARWLPAMAAGTCIGAIAMTEPDAGSNQKAIRTMARREGDTYVLSGQKTFISSGLNAGLVIVGAKTDPAAGARGILLLVVEDGMSGFSRGRALRKIGLRAQDAAELYFDDVRVPVGHRLGQEGQGFMADGGIGSAWVDARVARIYGGSNEIMREIVARGL